FFVLLYLYSFPTRRSSDLIPVKTIRFFYIFIFLFSSSIILAQIENSLHKKNSLHAEEWVHYYIERLEPQQVQMVANILYLLYAKDRKSTRLNSSHLGISYA